MSTQPAYNAPPTSPLAIVSLVAGILSWIMLPVVGAIAAVICGHMARRDIRDSRGSLGGDGLAVGGLLLGYIHLVVIVLGVLAFVLFLGGLGALLAFAN